jgi:hypothetical protein
MSTGACTMASAACLRPGTVAPMAMAFASSAMRSRYEASAAWMSSHSSGVATWSMGLISRTSLWLRRAPKIAP